MPSSLACLFHPPHHTPQSRSPPHPSHPSVVATRPSSYPSVLHRSTWGLLATLLLLLTLTRTVRCQSTLYATWMSVPSPAPPARCQSSFVSIDGQPVLLLVGGRDGDGPLNDVWLGRVDESQDISWQQQLYFGSTPQPSARYGQSAFLNAAGSVLLYGGVDQFGRYLDDIWAFSPASAGWSVVRIASFDRRPTSAAPSFHTVQPSARAFMHWRPFTLTFGALRSLPAVLQTANLLAFLNNTSAAPDTVTLDSLLLFGGRSSSGDIYSTEWSNQPLIATNLTDPSSFNTDFGDQWLYVYEADTWIRVGNVTCVEQETVCRDYTTVANLSAMIPDLLSSLNEEATSPSRPAGLYNRTIALLNTTAWFHQMLYSVDQTLRSNPNLTHNDQNSCTSQCLQKQELPSPVITIPPTLCTETGTGISLSGSGVVFCNVSTVGNQISQLRPNATEGSAMGTHHLSNGTASWTYLWSFGGFGCAANGVDIFTVTSWADSCFIQALSVLSPTSLVWFTFTPPQAVNSQYINWPSARAYASMAIDQTSSMLWLYGGAGISGGQWSFYNDLYAFDITARAWVATIVTSTPPIAGLGASLVWLPPNGNTTSGLYLFGGCTTNTFSDQLLMLQTSSTVSWYNWQATGGALSRAVAGVDTSFILTAVAITSNGSFTNNTLGYAVGLGSYFAITISATDTDGNTFVEVTGLVPTEIANGVYAVNYTVDYGATLSISIGFLQNNDKYVGIPGSPFSLTLLPNEYLATSTILSSSNYSTVEKGTQTFIVVQLRDQFSNALISSPGIPQPTFFMWYHNGPMTDNTAQPHCINGGVHAMAEDSGKDIGPTNSTNTTTSGDTGTDQFHQLEVFPNDNMDGTFTLAYIVPPVDAYYLYVLVDCDEIVDSPFAVSALSPLVVPVGLQAAFLALASVVGSVVLGIAVVLVLYRSNRVIRAGSPLFLVLICFGVLLCVASVPIYAYPSSTNCRLFPFLLTTGYIIALSALCSKSYRVLLIFIKHELNSVALGDSAMLVPVVVLLACETILNLVWLVVSPLNYNEYRDSSTSILTYHACGGEHATAFISASVAFNGLIALWGVWLALQIRHVPEAFSESKLMGAALYNLALVMAITIPLTWTASNTQSSHEDLIIPGAAILWCSFVTIALVVAPKLYHILYPPPQHFFDGYPNNGAPAKGVNGRRGADKANKQSNENEAPVNGSGASPANTTVNGPTWSPANVRQLPSSSSPVRGDAGRSASYQPSSKWQSHSTAAPASSPASLKSVDGSPLQLSPALSSSADKERQFSAASTPTSLHQVQIDIQSSMQQLSSPNNGMVCLISHEQHTGSLTAVSEPMESATEGNNKPARTEASSLSPPSTQRSAGGSRSSQPPPIYNTHTQNEHARHGYASSPALQYGQSSISSPLVSATSPLACSSTPSNGLRASVSVDDIGYQPARSIPYLPPGPLLTVSVSHTGSPVRSSVPRVSGSGVRVPTSAHRSSSSSQQPPQPHSAVGSLSIEQPTLVSLATPIER